MALREYLAGEVAEDYADGLVDRREALRRLGLLGLGLTGAVALLAACGGDGGGGGEEAGTTTTGGAAGSSTTAAPGAGQPPGTGSPDGEPVRFAGPNGELQGAFAAPAGAPRAAVLVIHENRGLTPHFFDLVGRLAAEGYAALCVDLLSEEGGTAALGDAGAAQGALGQAGDERIQADLAAGIGELQRRAPGVKVGAMGFCFGGGLAWRLLAVGEDRLSAVVPFYGPSSEGYDFSRAKAAVLGIYAGRDGRINQTRDAARMSLEQAGLVHDIRTFDGADHGFFNDTGGRYDPRAAAEAWSAVLAWFADHLA